MTRTLPLRTSLFAVSLSLVLVGSAIAQVAPSQNKANWKLANRFTSGALQPFLYSTNITPGWINKTDVFWYSWKGQDGVRFWKVDCKAKKKTPLFDSAHMAALLSEALKRPFDTTNLPITTVTFDEKNSDLMRFNVQGKRFEYDLAKDTLKEVAAGTGGATAQSGRRGGGGGGQGGGGGRFNRDFRNYSPDKSAYVYAQDYNLYYVAIKDKKEQDPIQLTKDGERYYSFGSRQENEERQNVLRQTGQLQQFQQQQQQQVELGDDGGDLLSTENRVRANVTWSKDSKRFYVTRDDDRKVKDLYLVNSLNEPRPSLLTYRYTMPGEANVTQTELLVFEPTKKELHKMPIDKFKDQTISDIHWQDNTSDVLRFVRMDRFQRSEELCEIDLTKEKVKPLIAESVENSALEQKPTKYVKPGGDMIWWSQRSGWGHYYLYSNDGTLKHAITSGPYRANNIVEVDGDKGLVYFNAYGREPGENPYYKHLYRINVDGTGLTLMDPGDADHTTTMSNDKKYVVDASSRVDMEPRAVLRDDSGKVILELEQTDLSRLKETGWRPAEVFKVKAADGVTDIYGNMWKPFDFDATKKYPIIANVYPGPQTEGVSTTFSGAPLNQRLAQLGFIVIQIGNRGGNPLRSAAYENFGYFNLRDYGLADKKAGIEQLAARYPWIDIDRVGIYGHSGGGFMTAAAMLVPPYNEFFKVGVSSSGNHDNNVYNQNWSEQYHGLREVTAGKKPDDFDGEQEPDFDYGWPDQPGQFLTGGSNDPKLEIHVPTNAELAPNLKGSLLLVHGDMDNNVHYAGTVRLMNALMRANKRFEYLVIPGKPHAYGDLTEYFNQRLMEHFAMYLLGDKYGNSAEMTVH